MPWWAIILLVIGALGGLPFCSLLILFSLPKVEARAEALARAQLATQLTNPRAFPGGTSYSVEPTIERDKPGPGLRA
jgi:hypothetical protein